MTGDVAGTRGRPSLVLWFLSLVATCARYQLHSVIQYNYTTSFACNIIIWLEPHVTEQQLLRGG